VSTGCSRASVLTGGRAVEYPEIDAATLRKILESVKIGAYRNT
jgi:hypothetical protein